MLQLVSYHLLAMMTELVRQAVLSIVVRAAAFSTIVGGSP
jgi:hypothetical protein